MRETESYLIRACTTPFITTSIEGALRVNRKLLCSHCFTKRHLWPLPLAWTAPPPVGETSLDYSPSWNGSLPPLHTSPCRLLMWWCTSWHEINQCVFLPPIHHKMLLEISLPLALLNNSNHEEGNTNDRRSAFTTLSSTTKIWDNSKHIALKYDLVEHIFYW